jgi:hypothetical protein
MSVFCFLGGTWFHWSIESDAVAEAKSSEGKSKAEAESSEGKSKAEAESEAEAVVEEEESWTDFLPWERKSWHPRFSRSYIFLSEGLFTNFGYGWPEWRKSCQ